MIIAFLLVTLALLCVYGYILIKIFNRRRYGILTALIIAPVLAHEAFQHYWYLQIIPQDIGVTYPIAIGDESDYFREGCGVAVYRLSDKTLEKINEQGLQFFSDALQARGHTGRYHTYSHWKETPFPLPSEGNLFWCSVISQSLVERITAAAIQPGSFYAIKPEGFVLVIPSLRYVIFSHSG